MSGPFLDFVVDCCAQANWIGYGRAIELLCEFLDQRHGQMANNQELIDFLDWKAPGVDTGSMPERLTAYALFSLYGREAMKTEFQMLEIFCDYVDEVNYNQMAMGFFEDMVDDEVSSW